MTETPETFPPVRPTDLRDMVQLAFLTAGAEEGKARATAEHVIEIHDREVRAEAAELIADEAIEIITDLLTTARLTEDDSWEAVRKTFSGHLHEWAEKFRKGLEP